MAQNKRKKYKFKPNKNTLLVLLVLILFIWVICGIRSCTKYDRSLRGATYTYEAVLYPEYQVRDCVSPDGTPSADYTEIYPAEVGDKVVYLTFDDGPSSKVTPQVLDVLKQYNVKATFFALGKNVEKYPELAKRIADEGHSIASHSYSHDFDTVYSDNEGFLYELNSSKEAIKNIVGEENYTDIFRFPGGAFREERAAFKEILIQENVPFVNWNCMSGDAETSHPVSANLIETAKKTAKKAGSDSLIMLMHDAGAKQATVDALPGIIEYFQSEGYRFDSLKRY